MDKLFQFTRDYRQLIEYPYAVIVVWNWCPAWCDLCSFSDKVVEESECFDFEVIQKLIEKIHEKFFSEFEILFHGVNLLKHPFVRDMVWHTKSLWRWVRMQLETNLTDGDINILKVLLHNYWDFSAIIRVNIRKPEDFKIFYDVFKKLLKVKWLKVYYEIFLDREKYSDKISSIMKLATTWSNNEYNCIIWDRVDIKFHNYVWRINAKEKCIDNIDHTECYMKDMFDVRDNHVFIDDHIEVQNNWDFIFHDDLCYIGQPKIANIFSDDKDIYKLFLQYKYTYLEKLKNNSPTSCYKCIKNKYHYEKDIDSYNY